MASEGIWVATGGIDDDNTLKVVKNVIKDTFSILANTLFGVMCHPITMNRLAVGRSARAQQAHKVNNRINRLTPLHKTDRL